MVTPLCGDIVNPSMPIELFWGRTSPYSERVLLGFAVKGLPYIGKRLNFSRADLQSKEFLAVNPRAQVPAIRDGQFVLHESIAILGYLDSLHPEPPLFGRDAQEQGLVWQLVMECVYWLEPHMSHFAGNILSGNGAAQLSEVIQSRQQVEKEFNSIEIRLAQQAYLAGPQLTAADLVVYPVVHLLIHAAQQAQTEADCGKLRTIEHDYPALFRWCENIRATPGFDPDLVWS